MSLTPTQIEALMDHAESAAQGLLTQVQREGKPQPPRSDVEGISDASFLQITKTHLFQQMQAAILEHGGGDSGGGDNPDPAMVRLLAELELEVANLEAQIEDAQATVAESRQVVTKAREEAEEAASQRDRAVEAVEKAGLKIDELTAELEKQKALRMEAEQEVVGAKTKAEEARTMYRQVQQLARKFAGIAGEAAKVLQMAPGAEVSKKEGVRLERDIATLTEDAGGLL